jgi:hypothetical protein
MCLCWLDLSGRCYEAANDEECGEQRTVEMQLPHVKRNAAY